MQRGIINVWLWLWCRSGLKRRCGDWSRVMRSGLRPPTGGDKGILLVKYLERKSIYNHWRLGL